MIKPEGTGADTHKMKGVLVCAVLVVALMAVIKDGRVLRKMGLSGSCAAVSTPPVVMPRRYPSSQSRGSSSLTPGSTR